VTSNYNCDLEKNATFLHILSTLVFIVINGAAENSRVIKRWPRYLQANDALVLHEPLLRLLLRGECDVITVHLEDLVADEEAGLLCWTVRGQTGYEDALFLIN